MSQADDAVFVLVLCAFALLISLFIGIWSGVQAKKQATPGEKVSKSLQAGGAFLCTIVSLVGCIACLRAMK